MCDIPDMPEKKAHPSSSASFVTSVALGVLPAPCNKLSAVEAPESSCLTVATQHCTQLEQLLWRHKTCPAVPHHEQASTNIVIIITVIVVTNIVMVIVYVVIAIMVVMIHF